ncbi:MAG: hypothetical protein HKN43_03285, partial [Rhodothermales bacterium]|nr:hypothetical protein [Rhodothermales bacterium]
GLDRTRAWTGSFTVVTVPSYKMAEDVIDEIESGNKSLDDYPGALRYNNVDMTSVDKWGSHSVRLPVGEPKIVVLNDGEIGVVQVRSKTGVRSSFEDYRESLRSSLLPYVNEYHTVNRLRESQSVQVDSSLFELIMDLDSGIE